MEQSVHLVLRPDVVGPDPVVTMIVTAGTIWLLGTPWVKACVWLGARLGQAHSRAR